MLYFLSLKVTFGIIMDCLNRSNRYRMPPFETCVKSAFKEPVVLLPVMEGYPFFQSHKGAGNQYHFQPPRFIVGGFVGSKICEHKNGSANYSDLLGRIINILTTFKPSDSSSSGPVRNPFHAAWPRNSGDMSTKSPPRSYAEVTVTSPAPIPSVPKVISSPVIEMASPIKKASPLPTPPQAKMSPSVCVQRTVSESSDTSWASSDPADTIRDLLPQSSNPWLNNMVVCVSDGSVTDDDDNDSDWDCVDDYQSENGEIISGFQWQHGDCLSPISSPVSQTPPAANIPNGAYDSDDEDEGVLISCNNPYAFDEEEEAREQQERIRAANQRWEQQGSTDEPDGKIVRKSTQGKQV